jgi:hypothetical protein
MKKKIGSFSLIMRVILSAGAMLIFYVYFQLTICPEGRKVYAFSSIHITPLWGRNTPPCVQTILLVVVTTDGPTWAYSVMLPNQSCRSPAKLSGKIYSNIHGLNEPWDFT